MMVLKGIIFASISTLLVCGSGGNVLNNNRTVTTNSSSGIKTSVPWTPMTTPMTTPRQQIAPTEKASSGNKPSKNSVNHDHSCNCHHNNYGNLVLSIPLTAVTVAFVFFVAWHRRTLTRRLWQPVSTNDESVISNSAVASQEQLKGDLTLEQLEHEHLEVFEWMCTMLDNGRTGRDYERLASKYQRITLENRQFLQNEFQTPGGSPSKALMKHLQALYPDLPLRDLLNSFTQIARDDIVLGVTKKVNNKVYSTVV